jgi:hypothetical protein
MVQPLMLLMMMMIMMTISSCAVTSLNYFFAVGLCYNLGSIVLNAVMQNWVCLSLPLLFFFASAIVRLFCSVWGGG